MASTTAKAVATARELLDLFAKEVATTLPSQVQTSDTNGNPVLTLSQDSTPAAGEKVIVIRIQPLADWSPKDILGLASQMYTPHQIDICTETNAAATPNVLTTVELLPVLAEIAKRGMVINWYQTAALSVPSVVAMTSSNLTAKFADLYWSASKAQ
jgi:hypothetical protein